MQKRLTSKTVESLPAANGKRYEVRDELVRGLIVRVSSTGAKVYYVNVRSRGVRRRIRSQDRALKSR